MNEELSRIYTILKEHKKNDFQAFYDMGYKVEGEYGCCGQCTIVPFVKLLNIDENLFKYASGFCAGIAHLGEYPCGAFNGGATVISYFFGREISELKGDVETSKDVFRNTCRIVREYEAKFKKMYGGCLCKNVQTKIFGRSYNLLDKENDAPEFEKKGAHIDKCTSVVGSADRLLAQIIYDELGKILNV